MIFSTDI